MASTSSDQPVEHGVAGQTEDQKPCLRGFAKTTYQAKSWNTDRRACARIETTTKGLDIRFVVTRSGSAPASA